MSEFSRRVEESEEAAVPDLEYRARYGGAQGQEDEDAKRKEREAKKAEVRKRLEEAGAKGKKKKGFLTPERKKKLRKLLMMKAAEDLKQQQLKKEQERQKILAERTIPLPPIENCDDAAKLMKIYEELFTRYKKLEEEKFDVNQAVQCKDAEINELTIAVNDLRGKYVKPSLKKVSKYDNRFKKMQENKEEKQDFRSNLKVIKKDIDIEDLMKKKEVVDWSKDAIKKEKTDKPPEPAEKKPAAPKEEKKEEAAPEPAAEEEAGEEEEGEEEEGEEEEEEE